MPYLKYRSALICGLSVIVLTLGTSAVPSLAQSTPESARVLGSDVLAESTQDAEAAPTFGVSIVDATDDFRTAAVDLLGDRFVEFWLTPTQDHFVVGVLDLQASEVAYLESTLRKVAAAEVVDREVSRQELDTLAADVLETVEQEAEITSFGVFYDKGIIEVKVKPSDFQAAKASANSLETAANVIVGNAARAATLQLNTTVATEPRVAVVAQTEQPEVQESHYSAPFKGGKRLLKHVSGNWVENCTAGFLLQGGTDPQNAYGLTAGHCGPNGQQMAIGNNSGTTSLILGGLVNNTIWQKTTSVHADAAVFPVPNGNSLTPSIYVNSNLSRTVVAKAEAAAPYTRVCISGSKTTNEMCGNITRTNWDTTFAAAANGDQMSHVVHHTYHVVWDNGNTTQGGDSGAPVYAVNPDGTAIAVGIHTGSAPATASDPAYSVFSSMWWSLDLTGTKIRTADRVPVGNVEGVNGTSGKVVVSGWIIDPDLVRTAASVHVYLGGPAGIGDGYSVTADGFRSDVASAYPNTGSNHGFAASLTTSRRGAVPVYIYGMNLGEGEPGNPLMYSGTVYVS